MSEGRCSLDRKAAELVVKQSVGRQQRAAVDLGGKLTSGKPYRRLFGAKFGHFVGDVEAKSGYGRSC